MSRTRAALSWGSAGFTLLEVLVALTIMGILLMTIYGAVSRTIRTKDHAEASARMSSTGREAVMHLADEIETALPPTRTIAGLSPAFQGFGDGAGEFEARFIISSRPPFGPTARTGGNVQVVYYLVPQQGTSHGYLLARSETPIQAQQDGQEPGDQQQVFPPALVTDNVAGLRLRYLDGNDDQWSDTWDSVEDQYQQARLPIAVEITLLLNSETGPPQEFSTTVDLPLGTRPTPTPKH